MTPESPNKADILVWTGNNILLDILAPTASITSAVESGV